MLLLVNVILSVSFLVLVNSSSAPLVSLEQSVFYRTLPSP